MKIASIFALLVTLLATLLGCGWFEKKIMLLDGPGMVYVDREHRTEYANTLPFDELDGYPFWAVAYLGEGEDCRETAKKYTEKLFSELSEEKRNALGHYDYGGEKWYLVIPRYGERNDLIQNGDEKNPRYAEEGTPFTINCNADVEIYICIRGGHGTVLDADENGRLIHTDEVWDITDYTEYKE